MMVRRMVFMWTLWLVQHTYLARQFRICLRSDVDGDMVPNFIALNPRDGAPVVVNAMILGFIGHHIPILEQLVLNDRREEDTSETEPILRQSDIDYRSQESSSEIGPVRGELSVSNNDCQFLDADEDCCLVNVDQPQCRICLDTEGEDLIAPCYCRGTQKYVHRSCLDNWRSTKEGFAFAHCTECRAVFVLRANMPPDRWWLRLKFQFLVVRDHALIFTIVQLIVALLGMLVYKFYGDELREMFGYEEHPYGFYTMAVLAILLVGLLYGFFIAIICGQRISERHYHVLAKQELTKEYVVENREGNKTPPELDPSHIAELRMLGLF